MLRSPITGNLRTLSTVDIKPEVGGRLIAIYFQEGDLVRKDQLLAEIDPVNYRLAYDQAAAALASGPGGIGTGAGLGGACQDRKGTRG